MCGCFGHMCTLLCFVLLVLCFCIVSFTYICSYLFCLYWCKDYCHRVTTQLQLVSNNNNNNNIQRLKGKFGKSRLWLRFQQMSLPLITLLYSRDLEGNSDVTLSRNTLIVASKVPEGWRHTIFPLIIITQTIINIDILEFSFHLFRHLTPTMSFA
jgi:hypothetical protein